jgi:hypothetical protein
MSRRIGLSLGALAFASTALVAQSGARPDSVARPANVSARGVPAYRNRIVGVFDGDTYQPVVGAEVSDLLRGTKSLTSATGNVSLVFLPEGVGMVRVRKLGYEAQTFMVSIGPEDSSTIAVVLSRVAELPPVVTIDSVSHYISSALTGFEERRKIGIGHFIDEAQLRKDSGRQLSNEILAHIPGVTVTLGGSITSFRARCTPNIYLDNVLVYAGGKGTPPNLSRMETDDYAGIEFYAGPATVPAQFSAAGTSCGVLLLWTRER